MNVHLDINQVFQDLHDKRRKGEISRDAYDQHIKNLLVDAGMLPPPVPKNRTFKSKPERSGCLSYNWQPGDKLASISFTTPWDGRHRLNSFPRHVRQAVRLELDEATTELEATKLQVARATCDMVYEAVMDDLLCARAEEIMQRQGPDTRRAVNLDERFRLADNPDVIRNEQLSTFIDGANRAEDDRER